MRLQNDFYEHPRCKRALPWLVCISAAIVPAVAAPPVRESEASAIRALDASLQKETHLAEFSGAVLVARDGHVIFENAYGLANREGRIPNTVNTKFRFGSMGKMFTAVAILQLVEQGKLQLDAPVSRYLQNYPAKDVAAVTIHQLLTHTGGTGDIFSPEFEQHREQLKELSDYIALYGNRGLKFAPGAQWDYSNYGFILLGRIIEIVSGESYYDYVREHIFEPARMLSTGNLPEDRHLANLAVGYTRGGGLILMPPKPKSSNTAPVVKTLPPRPGPDNRLSHEPPNMDVHQPLRPATSTLPYRGSSAGGGYSTVEDFLRFAQALGSHKLLNAHDTDLLTEGKVSTPRAGVKYAYGFEEQTLADGLRTVGHGGGAPGTNGRLFILPASGYVVAVLSNLDPPSADNIARFIVERLPATLSSATH